MTILMAAHAALPVVSKVCLHSDQLYGPVKLRTLYNKRWFIISYLFYSFLENVVTVQLMVFMCMFFAL
jgi:hypothetical protein